MKKLSFVDKAFLMAESREMPMHVGGVALYSLPDGANEQEFLHEMAGNMRHADALLPPFGHRLKTGKLGTAGNTYWEPDPALDMDYHIRHSALPAPGRYRELFTLVSRLHGTLLDRSRPLWEMHIIEGLEGKQFGVYTKTHHAAIDGARSIHISRSMLSSDPKHRLEESPLSLKTWEEYKSALRKGNQPEYSEADVRSVTDVIKASFDSSANLIKAVRGLAQTWSGRGGDLSLPHRHVPSTSLNGKIDGARRFVAQTWPFARIKAVGAAFDGTFNDAVLAMCSGALRTYLSNHGELPEHSLKAMVPVSLRQAGDVDSGNAVSAITADLATSERDPARRFRKIQASVQAGKDYFNELSPSEIELISGIMQIPSMLLMPLGLIQKLPAFNVTVSNVPGIREPMYWNGARMSGNYPLSIVTDGMAMNITLCSYDKQVDFGIIACRRSVPQVQRMIDYMEDSLTELEEVAGIASSGKAKPAPAKRKAKAAAKTKTKAKTKAPAAKKAKGKIAGKSAAKAPAAKKAGVTKAATKTKAKATTKRKAQPKSRSS